MVLQEELRSGRDINEDGKGHFELILPNTVLHIIPTRQVGFVLFFSCVFFSLHGEVFVVCQINGYNNT